MVWTAPMTAVAGAVFTAAQFNTHARDNLEFLYDRDRVLGSITLSFVSAYSVADATTENVKFDTLDEELDPESLLSYSAPGTTSAYIQADFTGSVRILWQTNWAANGTGIRFARVLAGGSEKAGAGPFTPTTSIQAYYPGVIPRLAVTTGDQIQLSVRQTSGAGLNLNARTYLTVEALAV